MQFYSTKNLGSQINGICIAAQDVILHNSTHKTTNKQRREKSMAIKLRTASKGLSCKKRGMNTWEDVKQLFMPWINYSETISLKGYSWWMLQMPLTALTDRLLCTACTSFVLPSQLSWKTPTSHLLECSLPGKKKVRSHPLRAHTRVIHWVWQCAPSPSHLWSIICTICVQMWIS